LQSRKKVANHKEQVVTEIQLPETDKAVYAEMPSSGEHANETRNKPIDQKIIKNATLRFETADISKTASVIISEIKKYNGFIESDNETKDYNSFSRRITVRVPNKFFENILNETTQGITYFDEKVITAQDVTSQYIDIEARLKAKRALENRYLELLRILWIKTNLFYVFFIYLCCKFLNVYISSTTIDYCKYSS